MGAQADVEREITNTVDELNKLPEDATFDQVQKTVAEGTDKADQHVSAVRQEYDARIRKTLQKANAPIGTRANLFALVIQTEEGLSSRVPYKITARSDSSEDAFPVQTVTPGLDQLQSSHIGVFAALMTEPAAPIWTYSIAVPLQVVAPRFGNPELDEGGNHFTLLSFDMDAFPGGVLASISRLTLPGSLIEQARRQLREQQSQIQSLRVSALVAAQYVVQMQSLQAQLNEAQLQNRMLERYDELLVAQIEKHSKPMAAAVFEGVVVKAVVAGITTLLKI